jgi:hypothetical protein
LVDGGVGKTWSGFGIFSLVRVHMTATCAEKEVGNAKMEERCFSQGHSVCLRGACCLGSAVPRTEGEDLVGRNAGQESVDPGVPHRGVEWWHGSYFWRCFSTLGYVGLCVDCWK